MKEATVAVSIVCNAYNHERYIRSALDGFVMQKTTFPFEVLIHDDASTDATADIIREYEKQYPDILKPIYSTENQYSKRDGSLARIQYGRVRGKYIAFCEGDDYWTDPLKLQKQYDLLEANPEINICATAALMETNGEITGKQAPANKDKVFSVEEIIRGGGGFVASASLMYRTSVREDPLPFFFTLRLDYTLQIAGSLPGGMAYLADTTCVYRMSTQGSWSERMSADTEKKKLHHQRVCRMLRCLDADTNGAYHASIDDMVHRITFHVLRMEHNYQELCSPEYAELLKKLPVTKRFLIKLGGICPWLVQMPWKLYQKVRKCKKIIKK